MGYSEHWIEILNDVAKFQKGKSHTWFRGQNKEEFELNSGIYRIEVTNPSSYIATEKGYYNIFKRMGYMHHKEDDDWNLLFLMQHHGVRTRLLDWTESFAVALFFAYEKWDEHKENAVVWLLDPLKLNYSTLGENKFYTPLEKYESFINSESKFHSNTLALYPFRNSSRIVSQQGMFTLQGNTGLPLEEEFDGNLISEGILKKIILTDEVKDDIKMYLKQNGISDFSLFPDLDGLAKHVNKIGYFYDAKYDK